MQVFQKTFRLEKINKLPEIFVIYCLSKDSVYCESLGDNKTLERSKNKIEKIDQNKWTKIRKFVNIYENPGTKSKNKPISRAYFKLKEILIDFKINLNSETFHIAESPGGFIQSVLEYKNSRYSHAKKCYTVSLSSSSPGVPIYHKSIIDNVLVEILSPGNGDITVLKNILLVKEKTKKHFGFVSADGGFGEYGNSFNNKEKTHQSLIISEITLALLVLEPCGTLVLKIFDIFTIVSCELLLLLSFLFEQVYITKPFTSRHTNSEKYLVCKYFIKTNFDTTISNTLVRIIQNLHCKEKSLEKIFSSVPDSFLKEIRDINKSFSYNQCKGIEETLLFIKHGNTDPNFSKKKIDMNKKWNEMYKL